MDRLVETLRGRADGQPGLTAAQRHAAREAADNLDKASRLPGVREQGARRTPAGTGPSPNTLGLAVLPWLKLALAFVVGAVMATAWAGRYDVHPAGRDGVMAWIHDR